MPCKGVLENFSFSLSPDDIVKRVDDLMNNSRKTYDSIAAVPDDDISYDTVLKVLDENERSFTPLKFYLEMCRRVSPNKALRDASAEEIKKLKAFEVEISMRQDVFNKLIILEKQKEEFKPEAKRYLERLILLGKRNGLHFDKNTLNSIKRLKTKISDLCVEFEKHLAEESTTFEFTEDELFGLSQDFLNLKRQEDTKKYVVSLKYPDFIPIMEKCRRPETRKILLAAFDSRCIKENGPIITEIVKLRHELANMLGYATHASYVTEILMSKTPEAVNKFLTALKHKLKPLWEEEKKYMLELKEKECQELGIPFDGKINIYDTKFYMYKVIETQYAVDQSVLKEYFPLPVVTQGLLDIYQELLDLKFEEVKNADVWHEDVQMFSVSDLKTGDLLGYFFLDMFPRDGKYCHAANFELQYGCLLPDGTRRVSVVGIVTNFTKPQKDKPSLLTTNEVETYFHEFGHTMHIICSQNEFAFFNSFGVERDFVEAPSQMLENWCWVPEPLKRMSSHFSDQHEIPEALLKALINSRNANAGLGNLKQIAFSLSDLRIHSSAQCDVQKVFHDTSREVTGIEPLEGTNFACQFHHLVDQYDAQYYGYLWSQVYSMDMFYTRFKDGKVMDKEVGRQYREKIIKPGSSKDAMDMLEDFLGRKPTHDAFLLSLGLKV